jgi:hypothetical protein
MARDPENLRPRNVLPADSGLYGRDWATQKGREAAGELIDRRNRALIAMNRAATAFFQEIQVGTTFELNSGGTATYLGPASDQPSFGRQVPGGVPRVRCQIRLGEKQTRIASGFLQETGHRFNPETGVWELKPRR